MVTAAVRVVNVIGSNLFKGLFYGDIVDVSSGSEVNSGCGGSSLAYHFIHYNHHHHSYYHHNQLHHHLHHT